MSASLKTTHYELGKYAPEDVTDYLTTYNGTMDAIDEAIYGADTTAQAAQEKSNTNAAQISAQAAALQATNETVTAQGKSIAAQGVQISNLERLAVGKYIYGADLVGSSPKSTAYQPAVMARQLGNGLTGHIITKVDAGTYSPDKQESGKSFAVGYTDAITHNLYNVLQISDNPFNLTETAYGWAIVYDASTNVVVGNVTIFVEYDALTGYTRFYARGGSTYNAGSNGQILQCYF